MALPTTDPGDDPVRKRRPPARAFGAGERFPTINAVSLTGRRTELPLDLAGNPALLLISFQRWQQELVAGWAHPLASLRREIPRLVVYEIATVSRRYLPARPVIDGGIGRRIRDPDARAQSLTAYVHLDRLVADLGLPGPENIALRLLDAAGRVVWTGRGVYDTDQLASLRRVVLAVDEAAPPRGEEER